MTELGPAALKVDGRQILGRYLSLMDNVISIVYAVTINGSKLHTALHTAISARRNSLRYPVTGELGERKFRVRASNIREKVSRLPVDSIASLPLTAGLSCDDRQLVASTRVSRA